MRLIELLLITLLLFIIVRLIAFPGRVPWDKERYLTPQQVKWHQEGDFMRLQEERGAH